MDSYLKPLFFVGSARDDLRDFPAAVRHQIGIELMRVQGGLAPTDWKPMASVGRGVREIRVHVDGEHRAFYVTNIGDAIYVLHAFQKKAQKTRQQDIETGKIRLKSIGG